MINVGVKKIKGKQLHSTNQSSDQEWLRKASNSMEILAINGVTCKVLPWLIVLSKFQIHYTILLDRLMSSHEIFIIYLCMNNKILWSLKLTGEISRIIGLVTVTP